MKNFSLIALFCCLLISNTSCCQLDWFLTTLLWSAAAGCGAGCICGPCAACCMSPYPADVQEQEKALHDQDAQRAMQKKQKLESEDAALVAKLAQLRAQHRSAQSTSFEPQLPRNSGE